MEQKKTILPLSVENVDKCYWSPVDEALVLHHHHKQNAVQKFHENKLECTETQQNNQH